MKKIIYFFSITFILVFAALILVNPAPCKKATVYSLNLCSQVLIPSLFPFTFCVIFILNSRILNYVKFPDKLIKKIFGMDSYLFSIFLLSLIGGYPLGAKIINEASINKKTSQAMLNYCVNAGPAFIITAIGNGIFQSNKIGILLFVSHIIPSFIIAAFHKKELNFKKVKALKSISVSDNFVISAASSASALVSICSLVILFSVITAYFNNFKFLKPITFILEVTNSVSNTQNILLISALLGFSGISVWCQVYSVSQKVKPKFINFLACRISHSVLSVIFTYLGIKLFGITLPTLSNFKSFSYSIFYESSAIGISLFILILLFMISLKEKNYTGNIINDIV